MDIVPGDRSANCVHVRVISGFVLSITEFVVLMCVALGDLQMGFCRQLYAF